VSLKCRRGFALNIVLVLIVVASILISTTGILTASPTSDPPARGRGRPVSQPQRMPFSGDAGAAALAPKRTRARSPTRTCGDRLGDGP
jgi:hypothetical protein